MSQRKRSPAHTTDRFAAKLLWDGLLAFLHEGGNSLFCDQNGVGYALLAVDNHFEIHSLRGQRFRHWLTLYLFEREAAPPPPGRLNAYVNLLEAIAARKRQVLDTRSFWREEQGELWIDLCDSAWRALRIHTHGWEVVNNPPPLFRRFMHQDALPEPHAGKIEDLLQFLPPLSDIDSLLALTWVTTALLPVPRPILMLVGPQGSGKTTMSLWLRKLVDPSSVGLLGRDERADLPLVFSQHAVPVFDNIDSLSPHESDLFCQAVTGRGIARRRLYTDTDEVVLSFRRAIIINALQLPSSRPDLLDRAIVIELDRLPQHKRQSLLDLEKAFTAARPKLFGGILGTLSEALARLPEVDGSNLGRMADFHRLGRAVALALGRQPDDFDQAFQVAQRRQKCGTLENPLAAAIALFARHVGEWQGEASELFQHLNKTARANQIRQRADHWPATPTGLGKRLESLTEPLAEHGVEIYRLPRSKKRLIRIRHTDHATAEDEERTATDSDNDSRHA